MSRKVTKLEKSQVEIEGTIPEEKLLGYEKGIVDEMLKDFEMPGFRKGKVPEATFRKEISDMTILEEMAERAIGDEYPKILEENKIDAIGRPEVIITKLARGNALEFKIKTAVLPEIALPDYKKIAKEEMSKSESVDVTGEEVDNAILELRKMKAHQTLHENMKEGEEENHDHNHEELNDEKNLPELNDEFAASLGDFKTVAELRTKIEENMALEKANKAHEKKRIAVMERIIDEAKIDVPEVFIQAELRKMMSRMEIDIANMGLKIDDYLAHVKKTREDLLNEWRKDAERRAILELSISEIAKLENIKADKEELEREMKKLLENYPDADPLQAELYVDNVLRNEKVFVFFENQK